MRCGAALAMLWLTLGPAPAGEPKRDRHGDPLPQGALVRLGTVQAHPYCERVAFSADGQTLITTSRAVVRHWDMATGRVGKVITRHGGAEDWQVISADGSTAATLSGDWLELHDLRRDRPLQRWQMPQREKQLELAISPDGSLVFVSMLTATRRPQALLLHVERGRIDTLAGVEQLIALAFFSADGRRLAALERDGRQRVLCCDTTTARMTGAFACSGRPLAFTPDGASLLLADGGSGALVLVDPANGKRRESVQLPRAGDRGPVAFSPDGALLAVDSGRDVTLWSMKHGRAIHTWPGSAAGGLAFSPGGKKLAAVDDLVRLLDVETGRSLWPDFGPLIGRRQSASHLFTAPAGRRIATWSDFQRCLQLWDLDTGRAGPAFPVVGRTREAAWFSSDGRRLHVATERRVQSWDVERGKELRRFSPVPADLIGDEWEVEAAGELPGGDTVRVVLNKYDNFGASAQSILVRWSVADGRLLERRNVEVPNARFVRVGPGADTLVARDQRINLQMGRRQTVAAAPGGFRAATPDVVSPDGRFLVGHIRPLETRNNELAVWEAATGRILLRVPTGLGHYPPAAISPDNRWLAIGHGDGIALWDLAAGKRVPFHSPHRTPDLHPDDPRCCLELAFLPGRRLIAGYGDWTALVWEMPKATEQLPAQRIDTRTLEDLGAADPRPAQDAVWALIDEPRKALALLREKIRPAVAPAAAELAPLLADLGGSTFARREAAFRRLHEYGHLIERPLETALAQPANAEQTRRLQLLLHDCRDDGPQTAAERAAVRAVQALEHIGGAEARRVLGEWAGGDAAALLTQAAQAALARMH